MGLLTPVEQQTKEAFGMVPMEERLSILPRYNSKQGLIAPQFIYDLAKAVSAPITAARGYQVTPEESVNTAVNAFGGGGIGTAPKGALRTFIGRDAKTWDKKAASEFLKLEKKGIAPELAWQQTNTFRSPDGKLRQEINDLPAFLKGGGSYGDVVMNRLGALEKGGVKQIGEPMTVEDIYYHPDLLKAYPNIANVQTEFIPKGNTAKGQMAENTLRMQYDLPNKEAQSVMLHELQHSIQQKEGFARGGSSAEFASAQDINDAKIINTLILKGNKPSEAIKWVQENLGRKPSTQAIDLGMKSDVNLSAMLPANEQYRKLAGEAEARAVQARMNMTPAQRSQTFPLKSYDVPINELIIKGLLQ
jgi:hypothetical protein